MIDVEDHNLGNGGERGGEMRARTMVSLGAAAVLLLGACGDDDDGDTAATTDAPAAATDAAPATEAPVATTAATVEGSTGDTASAGSLPLPDEICALAEQIFEQEDFPTTAQLEQYKNLAPEEIAEPVSVAADALIAAGGEPVALFNAFGEDDVEAAIDEIDAWEEENCGIPHSEQSALPEGVTQEIEDGATRVDVTATDFAFEFGPVEAGRTSFVLTNEGTEAHFLLLVKLAEGVTLEQLLASEDGEGMTEGEWETRIASAGDDEAVTFDVEPGTYGLLCFLPTTDGTPHTMLGMQAELTVT